MKREEELITSLDELIKLQAHYAKLLNMHDGGQRTAFTSVEHWIQRLRETGKLAPIDKRRKIVCLCGSTRFMDLFAEHNRLETLAGHIVLSVGAVTTGESVSEEEKRALDDLHSDKIELADEVLILNKDGYIGESTKREFCWAMALNRRVRFLEHEAAEKWMEANSEELGWLLAEHVQRARS